MTDGCIGRPHRGAGAAVRRRVAVLAGASWVLAGSKGAGAATLAIHPAERTPFATTQMILAVARAGARIVAVGDRGVVLLSDDDGASFRQARFVPAQAALTTVAFADAHTGIAGGQWGILLRTDDGGETWRKLRSDLETDRPIFSVAYAGPDHAIAVGLWSLLLDTRDGGASWQERQLGPPPGSTRADLNLTCIFSNGHSLFITAEGGKLLRSDDQGASWAYVETGYAGTFWTGMMLRDGTLLIGGLRGTIYSSTDRGSTWRPVPTDRRSSVTGFAQTADGRVVASALDGVVLTSRDNGASFVSSQRDDRLALTAVLAGGPAGVVIFSKRGVAP